MTLLLASAGGLAEPSGTLGGTIGGLSSSPPTHLLTATEQSPLPVCQRGGGGMAKVGVSRKASLPALTSCFFKVQF